MTRPLKGERASHNEVAAAAKARPGEWVRVRTYPSNATAKSVASAIRTGGGPGRCGAYNPPGAFETRTEDTEFDTEVYARFNPREEQS